MAHRNPPQGCDTSLPPMDPSRKRRIRLGVALTAAVLLAGALVYTSFSASSEAVKPASWSPAADPGRSYQLTGKVVDGSIRKDGGTTIFKVRDRDAARRPALGAGPLHGLRARPVPRRPRGDRRRHARARASTFVGERDSLITKCPSKFIRQDDAA